MPVIGTVTTITILGRVGLVLMIFVALLALCRPMTVAQREHCVAIMIEEGRFPLCFGMALLALNAQPSAMRIVSAAKADEESTSTQQSSRTLSLYGRWLGVQEIASNVRAQAL